MGRENKKNKDDDGKTPAKDGKKSFKVQMKKKGNKKSHGDSERSMYHQLHNDEDRKEFKKDKKMVKEGLAKTVKYINELRKGKRTFPGHNKFVLNDDYGTDEEDQWDWDLSDPFIDPDYKSEHSSSDDGGQDPPPPPAAAAAAVSSSSAQVTAK